MSLYQGASNSKSKTFPNSIVKVIIFLIKIKENWRY